MKQGLDLGALKRVAEEVLGNDVKLERGSPGSAYSYDAKSSTLRYDPSLPLTDDVRAQITAARDTPLMGEILDASFGDADPLTISAKHQTITGTSLFDVERQSWGFNAPFPSSSEKSDEPGE